MSTTESPPEQHPVSHRQWTEILGRCRFGTVKIAGKSYTALRVKAVAERVASFADADGTRVRPGIARVAVDLETDYRTVRDVLSYLRRLGLITVVRAGGGTKATEYRLTLPENLLDREDLEVWSPAKQALEIKRAQERHRGPKAPPRGPRGGSKLGPEDSASEGELLGPQDPTLPVDNSELLGPEDSASGSDGGKVVGSSGTSIRGDVGSSGTHMLGPQAPTTTQDQDTTTTTQTEDEVLGTVTTSRANAPATNPESPPTKCTHGLTAARRSDGRPACALCRVAEDRPAVRNAPLPADHVAPVIQLFDREAS